MIDLGNIHVESILLFFILTNFITLLFLFIIWFVDKRHLSIRYLLLSNLFQLIALIGIFIDGELEAFALTPYTNLLSTIQVTFWMLSIGVLFNLKLKTRNFIYVNLFGFVLSIIHFYMFFNLSVLRGLTSLIMVVIELMVIARIYRLRDRIPKRNLVTLGVVLTPPFINHLYRTIYRLTTTLNIESIYDTNTSVVLFISASLLINLYMTLIIIYLHFKNMIETVKDYYDKDQLTNVLTRVSFIEALELCSQTECRSDAVLGIGMLDLDDFKLVNDTYGHRTGDQVLMEFASTIKDQLREKDYIGRYGGEEFVLLIRSNNFDDCIKVYKRLQKVVRLKYFTEKDLELTFSAGVVLFDSMPNMEMMELIELADALMYESKTKGKNCITFKKLDEIYRGE